MEKQTILIFMGALWGIVALGLFNAVFAVKFCLLVLAIIFCVWGLFSDDD